MWATVVKRLGLDFVVFPFPLLLSPPVSGAPGGPLLGFSSRIPRLALALGVQETWVVLSSFYPC